METTRNRQADSSFFEFLFLGCPAGFCQRQEDPLILFGGNPRMQRDKNVIFFHPFGVFQLNSLGFRQIE
jgi:hypothetical protein